jgi:hypothetical protein
VKVPGRHAVRVVGQERRRRQVFTPRVGRGRDGQKFPTPVAQVRDFRFLQTPSFGIAEQASGQQGKVATVGRGGGGRQALFCTAHTAL